MGGLMFPWKIPYKSIIGPFISLRHLTNEFVLKFEPISKLGFPHISSMPNSLRQEYTYEEYNMKDPLSKIKYKVQMNRITNSLV